VISPFLKGNLSAVTWACVVIVAMLILTS
jgi:hypothetical protein